MTGTAQLREADEREAPSAVTQAVMLVVLLGSGLIIPPLLLLNIPILLLRAWLLQKRIALLQAVRLEPFACPLCAARNEPEEMRGELPVELTCWACKEHLDVKRAPRRNWVQRPAP